MDLSADRENAGRPISAPSRAKPQGQIVFTTPYSGPSGAAITAYEWRYKLVEQTDKRGEEVACRVSDWQEAEESDESGRLVVHQFLVRQPSGETRLASLEGALRLLGYRETDARAAGVKSLATTLKSRAKLQLEYDLAGKQADAYQAKQEAAKRAAATLPDPEFTDRPAWANGEAMRIEEVGEPRNFQVYYPSERDARAKAIEKIVGISKYTRAVATLPEEMQQAAPLTYGKLDDLKLRIERLDKKIAKSLVATQSPMREPDAALPPPAAPAQRRGMSR